MAKKLFTAAEMDELMGKADELSELAIVARDAMSACKIEKIADALDKARSIMVASRDLNNLALALFSLHDLQESQEKADAARAASEAKIK